MPGSVPTTPTPGSDGTMRQRDRHHPLHLRVVLCWGRGRGSGSDGEISKVKVGQSPVSSPHIPACCWEWARDAQGRGKGRLGHPKGAGTPDQLVATNWSHHHPLGHVRKAVTGYTANYL